jgi:tetratricopeptide (TPR) repeat protein
VTGWSLIEHEQDVEEGMRHIEEALKSNPDNAAYLEAKGLGLFKLDRMEEAKKVLEKAWDLRYEYNHEHYLLLQEVNQALAVQ